MKQTEEIKRLLERFLEADTTLDEERRLYAYFTSGEIAQELEPYREMMQDYASLMPKPQAAKSVRTVMMRPWVRWTVGIAAMLALVFGGISLFRYQQETSRLESLYAGSYMIVNGERIDDLRQIREQIEGTLSTAREAEMLAASMSPVESVEQSILSQIDDPQLREQVSRMLNNETNPEP